MICPKCSTLNDVNNAFCINFGEVFRSSPNLPPTSFQTEQDDPPQPTAEVIPDQTDYLSTPTVFGACQPKFEPSQATFEQSQHNAQQSQGKFNASQPVFDPPVANFNPSIPFIPPQAPPPKSKK